MTHSPPLEILDLRHFSAAQLAPLLRDEAARWQRRLRWDYTRASTLLLDYIDSRVLPGFVAMHSGRIVGYAFAVYEAAKAVIGDIYAFGETESVTNPICETLLHHLLDLLLASPGVDRIESQLLMFPAGALSSPFLARGFRACPRLFMICDLHTGNTDPGTVNADLDTGNTMGAPGPGSPVSGSLLAGVEAPDFRTWEGTQPVANSLLQSWRPEFYNPAADLIHRCYDGHIDSTINDQYRTVHGAQRFLHNIIRFPGCGVFDTGNSWVLRQADPAGDFPQTLALDAILLCSRVRTDVAHITQLCVSPALRGHGRGQMLLRHCAENVSRDSVNTLSLTVTEGNTAAVRFYERNGFTTLHRFDAMVWDVGKE